MLRDRISLARLYRQNCLYKLFAPLLDSTWSPAVGTVLPDSLQSWIGTCILLQSHRVYDTKLHAYQCGFEMFKQGGKAESFTSFQFDMFSYFLIISMGDTVWNCAFLIIHLNFNSYFQFKITSSMISIDELHLLWIYLVLKLSSYFMLN